MQSDYYLTRSWSIYLLIQNLIPDNTPQMREGICHMRQLHGSHKILLESRLDRQFDIFHISGTPVGLDPFFDIQKRGPASVTGGIAHTLNHFNIAVREKPHDKRLGPVHMGTEGAGNFDLVQLFQAYAFDHQFTSGIQRAFGKLNLTHILLGDDNVLVDTGFFCPGQYKLRLTVFRIDPEPQIPLAFMSLGSENLRQASRPITL